MENEQIKVTATRTWIDLAASFSCKMSEYHTEVVKAAIADDLLRALMEAVDAMAREGFGTVTLLPKLRAAISAATNGSKT